MKIRPLYDRILVKRIEEQQKTAGGLYIPDTAKEKPMEVRVGDKVLYGKYSGTNITLDGEEVVIIKASDILAKLG